MRILNIEIVNEDNSIKILFHSINSDDQHRPIGLIGGILNFNENLPTNLPKRILETNKSNNKDKRFKDILMDLFHCMHPAIIKSTFKTEKTKVELMSDHKGTLLILNCDIVSFTLPSIPHAALNLIGALFWYVNNIASKHFTKISYGNFKQYIINTANPDTEKKLNTTLEDYFSVSRDIKEKIIIVLQEEILKFNQIEKYRFTMNALQKIYIYYKENHSCLNLAYLDCISLNKRNQILFKEIIDCVLNPEITENQKLKFFFKLIRDYIGKGQNNELSFILSSINYSARAKLFELCIGKLSHEGFTKNQPGKTYDWSYTEWYLWRQAELLLGQDGKMRIGNLSKNQGYKDYYASGKKNYSVLRDELEFLGKLMNLEFAEGCDFHEEIVFTEASTEKLKRFGLHFNEVYLKKLLQTKNYSSFFLRQKKDSAQNLPNDMLAAIFDNVRRSDIVLAREDEIEARNLVYL